MPKEGCDDRVKRKGTHNRRRTNPWRIVAIPGPQLTTLFLSLIDLPLTAVEGEWLSAVAWYDKGLADEIVPSIVESGGSKEDCTLRDLGLLSQRRIQFAMQVCQIGEAFHLAEFSLRLQEPGDRPAQRLIAAVPAFTLRATRSTVERHDSMGLVVARLRRSSSPTSHTQSVHGERFFQALFQAASRAGIHSLQLSEDFLQLRFGFRVAGHGVSVADAAVIIALCVFRQIFPDVAALV